ncbi:flagellin lysine-N-methylase [Vogesella sp. AC12]|uniref:flagellin lysine-N-methylase n=1 Tax=Vogesella sp. AC12 TaxID=2950550 RepID=UPI00210CA9B4|nr:flagellin lysine-N-methylase [Vogesella sp. AC12]MCQ4145624.1 flagellin lysine-N-methylase [Vogesella sp. AC12]
MAETQLKSMIAPAYLAQFSCLGPACPDTCCYGWRIPVEHETYLRLQSLPDKELKPLIKKALHRGSGKSGSRDFGFLSVSTEDHARCELLDGEGLCSLHKKCGEQMLPDVCAAYPRATKSVAGVLEQFASPSCPEIARLIIENEHALQLQQLQLPTRASTIASIPAAIASPEMEQVRAFFLAILAATEVPLWQRLALQLLIAESLQQTVDQFDAASGAVLLDDITALLLDWQQQLQNGQALAALQGWQRHEQLHIKTLAAASRVRADLHFNRPRYLELITEALQALGAGQPEAEVDEAVLCRTFAATALSAEVEQWLGRILLNHTHTGYFPLQGQVVQDVQQLCMAYLLLRFWLVGLTAARQRQLAAKEVIELVYLFYRTSIHQENYLPSCMAGFQQAGLVKPEHWLLLLPD